jgi:hypothetical protein
MPGQNPGPTDIQAVKRELLRLGRERGHLTDEEIFESLPSELITRTEMETFFFTMEMMGIERRGAEAQSGRRS